MPTAPPTQNPRPTTSTTAASVNPTKPQSSLVYDLGDKFPNDKTWSNRGSDMDLETYFNPLKPNVGGEFGLVGLKPVLKDLFGDDYLLTDAAGDFYIWRSTDSRMQMFKKRPTMQEAIDQVLNGPDKDVLIPKYVTGGRR